mgnify:CR=1 FL=1
MYPIDKPKFSRDINPDFSKTLRKRVNHYFKINNISRNANANMVTKTIFMITLFFMPLVILSSGLVDTPAVLFLLYVISGFGMAGIGMSVMHDAIHGSYSKNKKINTFLGYFMDKYEQEFGFQTTSVFGPKNAPMSRKVNFMNMTDADIEALSEAKLKEGLAGRGVGVKKQLQKSELVKLAKRL